MPRTSKINWRKSDQVRLSRAVQRFNTKITRVGKRNSAIAEYQPSRLNVAELRKQITTRADYNRILKSIERYMKKGSEEVVQNKNGIKFTKYAKREAQINLGIVNRKRAKVREKVGEVKGKGTIGTIEQWEAQPEKNRIETATTQGEWERFYTRLERQASPSYEQRMSEQYKKNYITGLFNVFGQTEETTDLAELVRRTDSDMFIDAVRENAALEIGFFYDPVDQQAKFELIRLTLENL